MSGEPSVVHDELMNTDGKFNDNNPKVTNSMARMFIFSDSFCAGQPHRCSVSGWFPFEMMDCPSNQDFQGVSQGLTIHLLGTYILDDKNFIKFLILNSEP